MDWQGAMYLIFDTETTGLPKRWDAPIRSIRTTGHCIQIAWQLHYYVLPNTRIILVKPDGFNIPLWSEFTVFTESAAEKEFLAVVLINSTGIGKANSLWSESRF
jgi:DNA polymerase-3 subunit alpha